MSDDPPVNEVWRHQSVWSQAADGLKASIGRAQVTSLALTAASAVLATAAGTGWATRSAGPILTVAATVGIGLVLLLRPQWSGVALRDWTRVRSVSEALKSEVYLYLARAGDYAGPDRDARLIKSTDAVRQAAADLLRYSLDVEPVRRDLPEVADHASYFRVRVDGQVDGYYRPRARQLRARLARFRWAEAVLSVTGVVLGALAASLPRWGLGAWIAVVTTVTAAVAAHVGTSRYDYQLVEYLRTAEELERLRRAASRATSPAELDGLVLRCERVISIQNEGWMAKLSTGSDTEPGGTG